ncbi:MAG TPA: CHASE2 domain-containing protein [Hyphomicrobiales bacterium]|nr:CHASE2 domain-containing protein [Hyphomicrobiales bacterium]
MGGLLFVPNPGELLPFEHWTADWTRILLGDRISGQYRDLVVVIIDPATVGNVAPNAPVNSIPRDVLAKVILALRSSSPRAIGIDFYFPKPTDPQKDRQLIDAIGCTDNIVVGAVGERASRVAPSEFECQKKFISLTGQPAGYINLRHDNDNIVRCTSPPAAAYSSINPSISRIDHLTRRPAATKGSRSTS